MDHHCCRRALRRVQVVVCLEITIGCGLLLRVHEGAVASATLFSASAERMVVPSPLRQAALPGWKRRGLPLVDGHEKLLRTEPLEDGMEGFFVALFVRDAPPAEADEGGAGGAGEGRGKKRGQQGGDGGAGGKKGKRARGDGAGGGGGHEGAAGGDGAGNGGGTGEQPSAASRAVPRWVGGKQGGGAPAQSKGGKKKHGGGGAGRRPLFM